ncbi:hypothetical protein RH831_09395 [Halodesulfurarchaeum sp. HSR-GB]|uniref:hypothetical protein n=1 Tax=Halodesulfurarchaeum sp. HSR-GB TaxID=3074077 RepID=UPI0028640207|nr:hypothetical protein [Halodesulfurarchaeum sp. HSR-GB]MDR5657393.1 hypothetical protein [Halodesulfurarchaeum sp. HSR-GB]
MQELILKGVSRPHRIPPYLYNKLLIKLGVKQWGKKGPSVKLAELRHKHRDYPYSTTSIWDYDWDLLVVLDACRPEWMRAVKGEYDFINTIETIHSVGSHSEEWISNTFASEHSNQMAKSAYVTGNHYAEDLEHSALKEFKSAHDFGSWAYDSASPPANMITDLAIRTARQKEWSKLIVHYMQPHKPFLKRGNTREEYTVDKESLGHLLYHRYFNGELTVADLHAAFTDNLRYVLEEVKLLLENVHAPKTVITADHGQAFGEDGLYDHIPGVKHPSVREVPWVKTSAKDTESLYPREYEAADYDNKTVQENLKKLGYL